MPSAPTGSSTSTSSARSGPSSHSSRHSPADNATDALATRELVLTFSQNVTPGSGNITIRDLTDPLNPVEILIAANDPRLTYDQNVVRIEPAGLLGWSKNYAIRLDAGVFLGDGGAPIAAITDDTTWNFTTVAGDPLLDAIAALKAHVTGAAASPAPRSPPTRPPSTTKRHASPKAPPPSTRCSIS